MWTQFWDMHSGGGLKEKWEKIYIEAPRDEAIIIFYNRFGHNPHRVTCTCCGEDYSIDTHESLAQLTGFHRHCRNLEVPKGKNGLYKNDDPVIKKHLYLEEHESVPKGYKLSDWKRFGEYETLKKYCNRKDIKVIRKKDIKDKERIGTVPEEGYVWVG